MLNRSNLEPSLTKSPPMIDARSKSLVSCEPSQRVCNANQSRSIADRIMPTGVAMGQWHVFPIATRPCASEENCPQNAVSSARSSDSSRMLQSTVASARSPLLDISKPQTLQRTNHIPDRRHSAPNDIEALANRKRRASASKSRFYVETYLLFKRMMDVQMVCAKFCLT